MEKKCTKCGEVKNFSEFHKKKGGKNGLDSNCKTCRKEIAKEYRKTNADKIKERRKKYYKANADKIKERRKKYYKANADKIKEYRKYNEDKIKEQKRKYKKANADKIKKYNKKYYKANTDKLKEYRKENTDKLKEYRKEYYKANADKLKEYRKAKADKIKKYQKEYRKEYYKANADKLKEYRKKYRKNRLKTDPIYKLKKRLRSNIGETFKRACDGAYVKKSKTFDILGCDIEFFMRYISSKFQKGMTFENHGEWHLDHIIPISKANTEEDIIRLNHYTNFQPLWAEDNLTKSDKIVEQQLTLL